MKHQHFRFFGLMTAVLFLVFLIVQPAAAKEKWIKLQTKNFNIVGNADQDDLRKLALKLEQFRSILARLYNAKNDSAPLTAVVFKNDDSFKPFKPLYGGKPANVAGYFHKGKDENIIAINIEGNELHTIFHEYTHLLTSKNPHEWPLWLNEGIAEFYSTFNIEKNEASLGVPVSSHVLLLRETGLMPFQHLIQVDHGSPAYNERDKQGIFYAESWALVHYLVMGNKGARQPQLIQFLNLISSGVDAESAFKQAFNTDFAGMEKELRSYIQKRSYPGMTYDLGSAQWDKDVQVAPITDAEVQFHLGNLLTHIDRKDEAETYYKRSIELDPNYPRAQEGLGFLEMQKGDFAKAKERLKKAVASDSKNYLAHYYYAESLLREAKLDQVGAFELKPETAGEMINSLKNSIELMPYFPQSYYMLAFVRLAANVNLEEGAQVIRIARQLEPQNREFALMQAQIQARMKDYAAAKKTLEPLLTIDDETKLKALMLLNLIENASSSIASPAPDSNK